VKDTVLKDRGLLLKRFLKAPDKIGSITPSSGYLKDKMLANLRWDEIACIVELGAGTGVFTEYIATHKRKSCCTIVFEQDQVLRELLERQYPDLHFAGKAENIQETLKRFGILKADCIISSLPFATFPPEHRQEIVEDIHASLKDNGSFVAFQYSLQMHQMLKKRFKSVSLGFEIRNLPPAFIYYCKK
jgi:phospholipid N-methyltransferase